MSANSKIARLNDLLDAEINSVFAFVGESTPFLDRAHAWIRKPLADMVTASRLRSQRLADLIRSLDGSPIARGLQSREQHLSYLSIDFLLPKLIEAKQRDLERYRTARTGMVEPTNSILGVMIAEQLAELERLQRN